MQGAEARGVQLAQHRTLSAPDVEQALRTRSVMRAQEPDQIGVAAQLSVARGILEALGLRQTEQHTDATQQAGIEAAEARLGHELHDSLVEARPEVASFLELTLSITTEPSGHELEQRRARLPRLQEDAGQIRARDRAGRIPAHGSLELLPSAHARTELPQHDAEILARCRRARANFQCRLEVLSRALGGPLEVRSLSASNQSFHPLALGLHHSSPIGRQIARLRPRLAASVMECAQLPKRTRGRYAMTKTLALVLGLLFCSTPALAGGGLDEFLRNLNIRAEADPDGFSATLSTQFHISGVQVKAVLSTVDHPADAFMVFQIGEFCGRPSDDVLRVYRGNPGKGWGVIAKELGIKPGSAEFHALKDGDLHFGADADGGKGKGNGKGRGKGKSGK